MYEDITQQLYDYLRYLNDLAEKWVRPVSIYHQTLFGRTYIGDRYGSPLAIDDELTFLRQEIKLWSKWSKNA